MSRKKSRVHFQGGFLALPRVVLLSKRYLSLSSRAVKLLIDLGAQYNGKNNGDLSAAWKLMQPRGWKSEATLHKAKQELLEARLIAETRKGRLPNVCSLYGLTWLPLNPSPKLDIGPMGFPIGAWAEPFAP